MIEWFVPSAIGGSSFEEWWGRFERLSVSPGSAIDAIRVVCEIDVRDILPSVRVPTLVIRHVGDDKGMFRDAQQYMADQIPDARFVELPGSDHFAWQEEDGATEEIREFLTGERSRPETERILATILLTDIVRSTNRAAGSATGGGASFSIVTTPSSTAHSTGSGVTSSIQPETAS